MKFLSGREKKGTMRKDLMSLKKRSNCNLCYKKGKVFKVQHYCKVCDCFSVYKKVEFVWTRRIWRVGMTLKIFFLILLYDLI